MAKTKKKTKKEKYNPEKHDAYIKAEVIPALRKVSRWWVPAALAKDAAKVKVPDGLFKNGNEKFLTKFRCSMCSGLFNEPDIEMDHIDPVMKIDTGFDGDWTGVINRMLCKESGFRAVCETCHSNHTDKQKELRKEARTSAKKNISK